MEPKNYKNSIERWTTPRPKSMFRQSQSKQNRQHETQMNLKVKVKSLYTQFILRSTHGLIFQ